MTDPPATGGGLSTRLLVDLLKPRRPGFGVFVVTGAFATSLLAGALAVSLIGVSPVRALTVLVEGSVGSKAALADALVFATPRLFVALGAIVAIRCGVFNLGGEGQLQVGAIGAILAGTAFGSLVTPIHLGLALAASMVFGGVWAVIAIALKLWRGANEIIVTLMMNFVAIYLVQYLVQGPLQPADSIYNTSERVADSAELPVLVSGTRLHLGVPLAFAAAVAVWFLLYRTPLGVRLRATGLNPRAARLQGLSVGRLVLASMAISGSIAGLAGASEVLGVQFRLIQGFSSNFGFEGLAIAFLARLEPFSAVLVAVYFGMVQKGTTQLESVLGVPSALAFIMEALPIIFLAGAQGWLLLRGRVVRA
ncbi:ABC transporter permease [soil metagenome]